MTHPEYRGDPRIYDGHPIINDVEAALRELGATDRESARDRLRMLTYHAELTPWEIAAVMHRFLRAEVATLIADSHDRPVDEYDARLADQIIAVIQGPPR